MTPRPLRIVHLTTRVAWGGAEENTFSTCADQVGRGHSVWLIAGRDAEPQTLARLDPRVRVLREPSLVREISPSLDARCLSRLTRTLGDLAPDVVHTHMSKAGILGRLAAARVRTRVVIHGVHVAPFVGTSPVKAAIYKMLERSVAPKTDAWICVSEDMRDVNLAAGIGDPARMHVVHSGMDLDRFRRSDGPPPDLGDEVIVCVAGLEPRKRIDTLLTIFAQIAVRRPNARLVVLGEGWMRPALEAQAQSLGVQDRVTLAGWQPDPERWMHAAAVCVLLSGQEGLPRAVVQYVASGRPVVATAVPGIERLVRDGETGFLVPVDDPHKALGPIERLLADPDLRSRMSAATAQVDLAPWEMARMARDTQRVLDGLIGQVGEEMPA